MASIQVHENFFADAKKAVTQNCNDQYPCQEAPALPIDFTDNDDTDFLIAFLCLRKVL